MSDTVSLQNSTTHTLALDIEGTLISHASTMIPRPGLYVFLEFCKTHFQRIVFFSFVDEEPGRRLLSQMVTAGHMPHWVLQTEYVTAIGGRPGPKNLALLGVDPECALLVDDQPQTIPLDQRHRLIQVAEFKAPFPYDDQELELTQKRLLMFV